MCGIAGIIGRISHEEAVCSIRSMIAAQVHRGPDDEGIIALRVGESTVALGSRRLAILDLSPLGHQPMRNPDTGDVLVHNGEIYNFQSLRRTLAESGVVFRSGSDSEVILRLFERSGSRSVNYLSGMFAFAVWDARRERLVVARDHLGIKPLYYAILPGKGFLFASEVRALLASGLVSFVLDRRALAGYLAYGAVQEPVTIVGGVSVLPAGSWIEVDVLGRITARDVYWKIPSPEINRCQRSGDDLVAEGRALLQQAVRRHLVSDVPIGVFLSSGLDSTAVLGFAREEASDQVQACTVTFPDDSEYDEGPLARQTARRLGVVHHECPVGADTALQWALEGLDWMDQPTMDGLNTYIVSRAVRERGIVVALSGQGGDEIFGGYPSFREVPSLVRKLVWLNPLPPSWRAAVAGAAAFGRGRLVRQKAQDMARAGPSLLALYFHRRRVFSNAQMTLLGLNPRELDLTEFFQPPELNVDAYIVPEDPVASIGRLESRFYLGNMLLRDGDVFGMANSLEIRFPFLDKDLLEWAYRIPGYMLLPEGSPTKALLRLACADFYSQEMQSQNKHGFTLPIRRWMRTCLRDIVVESVKLLKSSGLLDPRGIEAIWKALLVEPNGRSWSRVWTISVLGLWLAKHHSTFQPTNQHSLGVPIPYAKR